MFSYTLAEPRHSIGTALQSTVVHASLIAGAIWGTRPSAVAPIFDPPVISIAWPVQTTPHPVTTTSAPTLPGAPAVQVDVPSTDPIPDLPVNTPIDPSTLIPHADPGLPVIPGGVPSASTILFESEVDELPMLLVPGRLRYPSVLAEAGMTGAVTLSFVIDAKGKVEDDGIDLIATTFVGFVDAAKEAVLTSRFRPARKDGHTVRVRVRQTVTFRR